jgi:hypothetical protein
MGCGFAYAASQEIAAVSLIKLWLAEKSLRIRAFRSRCPFNRKRIIVSCERPVKLRVADCVADCVWLAVPQPTEWQRIGD